MGYDYWLPWQIHALLILVVSIVVSIYNKKQEYAN